MIATHPISTHLAGTALSVPGAPHALASVSAWNGTPTPGGAPTGLPLSGTLAVILAFGVGISLGLLGGGGSVLSVPLLVYVAGWEPHQAATGSLVIVGITSGLGLISHARAGRVQWRTGLVFGLAGMTGAYAGGRLAALVPGTVLLASFALLMLAASVGMIRGRRTGSRPRGELRLAPAVLLGVAVGAATGFVGAGGGFIIVPALVLVAGLPMAPAVGTSLLVISMQSAAGFAGHLDGAHLPWGLTLAITASAVAGSLTGGRLTDRIPAATLRRGFGYLVLVVAVLVLGGQLPASILVGILPWAGGALVLLGIALRGPRSLRMPAARASDTGRANRPPRDPGPPPAHPLAAVSCAAATGREAGRNRSSSRRGTGRQR
jgi:uncharacterized membrane protein YfcA